MNVIVSLLGELAQDQHTASSVASELATETVDVSALEVRVLLIGLGPHADRTYVPHIARMRAQGHRVTLCAIVESEKAEQAVTARCVKHELDAELVLIDSYEASVMNARVEIVLNRSVTRHRVNAVIVATPPEVHTVYTKWALRRGLPVLMDKPITAPANAVSDVRAARGIREDVVDLLAQVEAATRRDKRLVVSVNAQRRWHPGFDYMRRQIEIVRDRTGIPITHISASHADGQFRFPHEWIDIGYHGFDAGLGKISHSGYHEIDMVCRLFRASWTSRTRPERAYVGASLIKPTAQLRQLGTERLEALFGCEEYRKRAKSTDAELNSLGSRLGEMDASIQMNFVSPSNELESTAGIALQHNSVSARSWLDPRANLYKESGRMKQERWIIHCGPALSMRMETFQAVDKHDHPGDKRREIGGENHFEIAVRRNTALLGGGSEFEVLQADELAEFDRNRLQSEEVKEAALREFVAIVQGRIGRDAMRSDLRDHLLSASVMSASYVSHVRGRAGRPTWIPVRISAA